MSFRTIILTEKCKCSYKNDYLVVYKNEPKMIHLSEIEKIIVESVNVTITSYLISECIKRKIDIIFCDEKHNPSSELISFYGSHNTSKKVLLQCAWSKEVKDRLWQIIIKEKIKGQLDFLKDEDLKEYSLLAEYYDAVEMGDNTNREGHAAKVYFNALFGKDFSRDLDCFINSCLDYIYIILLSAINRAVVSCGYITQIGIKHCNEFNEFNLSCDLIEPLRPLADRYVCSIEEEIFDRKIKIKLIDFLNSKVKFGDEVHYLNDAILMYVRNFFRCIENHTPEKMLFIEDYEE